MTKDELIAALRAGPAKHGNKINLIETAAIMLRAATMIQNITTNNGGKKVPKAFFERMKNRAETAEKEMLTILKQVSLYEKEIEFMRKKMIPISDDGKVVFFDNNLQAVSLDYGDTRLRKLEEAKKEIDYLRKQLGIKEKNYEESWRADHRRRFATGEYELVPWANHIEWQEWITSTPQCDHFVHMSLTDNNAICFVESESDGRIGKLVIMKPSHYFARYVKDDYMEYAKEWLSIWEHRKKITETYGPHYDAGLPF